ncbi:hypothetical protein P168DRAFT_66752 [Aspergillus campestris IBT 28561]|uniref:Uncharacterized protein n=1 Tax=Aspergillus campestris (strain IBT 28561) TaxID=1392248 RepID=A0A2I1CTG9_ASPC2|nr:uncharacterized protein P168DRAFT_66752 [Aspergillus campestris IBT 28561]PKY00918.1 hypothetical protein P168DRAFT_66752 [Aspergillus campestris IBT 28561]
MSSEALPISPAAFTEAIKELPLAVVYAKASELQNSIAHLQRSNSELKTFVAESADTLQEKQELENYIAENEGVMGSMNERIGLLKAEVEGRGQKWIELDELAPDAKTGSPGANGAGAANGHGSSAPQGSSSAADRSGDAQDGEGEDGVYL